MFDFIRNNRRFLQFVLLILILPSFVFFGVQGYSDLVGGGNDLAVIGQQKVSQAELDNAMRNQMERYKQQFGANFDTSVLDTPEARERVLEGLLNQKAIALEAKRDFLGASDEKLQTNIRNIPGVMDGGKFNFEAYKRIAAAQGMSVDGLEARLRQDAGAQAVTSGLVTSASMPSSVLQKLLSHTEQARVVQELVIKPESYSSAVDVKPEAVQAYFDANKKQYEIAERAKVEYLVFDTAAVSKNVVVSDADIKGFYDQNQAKFGTPETRRASHILISAAKDAKDADKAAAKAKAEDLLKQVQKNPADFAKLATANSQDPGSAKQGGDLGFFGKAQMVKPFEDAAYALKPNEISAVVQSDFGFHIIKLAEIKAAQVKPMEAVRAEIDADIRKQKADKLFAEQAEQFSNSVYEQGDNFKATADKFKLEVKTLDGLNKAAASAGPKPNSPFNAKLAEALFGAESVKSKKNTEAVEVVKGQLVSARLVEYVPAAVSAFDTLKATIEAQVRRDQAIKAAQAAGEAELKRVQADASAVPTATLGALSKDKTVSIAKPDGLTPEAIKAIAKAQYKDKAVWVGTNLPNGQYGLYKVTQVLPAPAVDEARLAQAKQQVGRIAAELENQALMEVLRARHGAKVTAKPKAVVDAKS